MYRPSSRTRVFCEAPKTGWRERIASANCPRTMSERAVARGCWRPRSIERADVDVKSDETHTAPATWIAAMATQSRKARVPLGIWRFRDSLSEIRRVPQGRLCSRRPTCPNCLLIQALIMNPMVGRRLAGASWSHPTCVAQFRTVIQRGLVFSSISSKMRITSRKVKKVSAATRVAAKRGHRLKDQHRPLVCGGHRECGMQPIQ